MLYPDEVHEVSDLEPSDFLRPQHARLFALFREWAGLGERWDVGRIGDMLHRGTLPAIDYGGAEDLLTMPNDAVLPEQVPGHAEQVRVYALRRRAHALCAEGQEQVRTTESPLDYIERLSDRIGELVMSRKDQVRQTTAHEEAPKLLARIAERAQSQTRGFGLTTGIDELDAMLLGLHPGKLYLIAGRPGMGKSVLGRMVTLAAARHGHPVLAHSLEMPTAEVFEAMASADAHVDYEAIQRGQMSDDEGRRFAESVERLEALPIRFDERADLTLPQLLSSMRRFVGRGGKLVVVDYLQLVRLAHRADKRETVGAVSVALKTAAKQLGIPVVALAQLNRDVESRTGNRPMPSDLRESGSLEQDADAILMLYRPEKCETDGEKGVIEILIRKNRGGKEGLVRAKWLGQYQSIESFEPGSAPPPAATPTTLTTKKKAKAPKGPGYSVDPDDPGPMF